MMNFATTQMPGDHCPGNDVHGPRAAMSLALAAILILGLSACSGGADDKGAASQKAATLAPVAATASGSTAADLPKLAFDRDLTTFWSAGTAAPAWIQFDLGQPVSFSRVRLNVTQVPSGPTTHEISGGATPESLTVIGTLDGDTADGQWLELKQPANNIRYVKITTLKSPSWVAWREIEFYK